jgi:hypothetical protein
MEQMIGDHDRADFMRRRLEKWRRLLPLMRAVADFNESTLMMLSVRGGKSFHRDAILELENLCVPGLDIHRFSVRVDLVPYLDIGSE